MITTEDEERARVHQDKFLCNFAFYAGMACGVFIGVLLSNLQYY